MYKFQTLLKPPLSACVVAYLSTRYERVPRVHSFLCATIGRLSKAFGYSVPRGELKATAGENPVERDLTCYVSCYTI
jgi:hypothetical protein